MALPTLLAPEGLELLRPEMLDILNLRERHGLTQSTRLVLKKTPQDPAYANMLYAGHEGGDRVFVRKP